LFKDPNTKPENDNALLHDVANGYAHLPAFSTTRWKDVYYEINKEFNNLLNDGLHTPEQSCQLIDRLGNRILSEARKEVTRTPFFEWLKLPAAVGVAALIVILLVRRRLGAKRTVGLSADFAVGDWIYLSDGGSNSLLGGAEFVQLAITVVVAHGSIRRV
jgi:hypothetical protein